MKILTKLLSNRLASHMNDLVNESQTATRVLFYNIVTAQEVLFKVKKNKSKGILLKIDLEKAFDRLNGDF